MGEPTSWVRAAVDHVAAVSHGPPLDRSLRVTLNFHPDRWAVPGADHTVVEALARDGVYRSQFETGTSNGGLTAHPGGDRWLWEQRLFGGAYDEAPLAERPKYGALDHEPRPLGGAPRFGSAHLRLAGHTLDRTTFCFPDSYLEPESFGTAGAFDLLGLEGGGDDALDGYVEAQVHGTVELARDVEALVLDPCFRGTGVETAAARIGVPLEWHEGRVLDVDELARHVDYRGPDPVSLGTALAEDGVIDARMIGDAARTGAHDPQTVKQVWHLVARWGSPRPR